MKETGTSDILGVFLNSGDSALFLDLAAYSIIAENNARHSIL